MVYDSMDISSIRGCTTFLSSEVKELFQAAEHPTRRSTTFKDYLLNDGYQIQWTDIEKNIAEIQEPQNTKDWFRKLVEELAPLFNNCGNAIRTISSEDINVYLQPYLTWTRQEDTVVDCIGLLAEDKDEVDHLLALLILTSMTERSLGNLLLTRRKQVPFLLRDLLVTSELEEILGKPKIDLCVILFGSVLGLNLRNVAWHGFLSPSEANYSFAATIIFILVECGRELESKAILEASIPIRPQTYFSEAKELNCAFRGVPQLMSVLEEIVRESTLIPNIMISVWFKILRLLEEERYGFCLVLLLPMLECSMRCLFALVNQDSSRVVTAENSSFYTTFDEILQVTHKKLCVSNTNLSEPLTCTEIHTTNSFTACETASIDDSKTKSEVNYEVISINKVPPVIGRKLNEALHDVLNFVQGPRVRDRLSHGEVIFSQVSNDIVHHIVSLSLLLLTVGNWRKESDIFEEFSIFYHGKDRVIVKDSSSSKSGEEFDENFTGLLHFKTTSFSPFTENAIKLLKSCLDDYQCAYHPSVIMLKSLCQTLVKMKDWTKWNRVSCSDLDYPNWDTSGLMDLPNYLSFPPLTSHRCRVISLSEINPVISDINAQCNVLYRSKFEIEYVSLFSKIVSCIQSSLQNMEENSTLKYTQFTNKSLRSRQRETYRRQLIAIPTIVLNCYFTCQVIHMLFISINTSNFSKPTNNLMKILKKVLKLHENVVSQTNTNQNRWDEASKYSVDSIEILKNEFG